MNRIAIACVLWAAACGSSAPSAPDAGAPDATPAPDGRIDAYKGTVTDAMSGSAIVGAQVCVLDHPDIACATTDATGAFEIDAADLQGAAIAFAATATDHLGTVLLETEPVDANGFHATITPSFQLSANAHAQVILGTQAGFTYPGEGTGFLLVRADGATAGSLNGATISIAPKSGKGPVYVDSNGPNPSLTATTAPPGAALFGNLAPGKYAVTVTATSKTCSVRVGGNLVAGDWAPSGSETTDVEIAADAETLGVFVTCL